MRLPFLCLAFVISVGCSSISHAQPVADVAPGAPVVASRDGTGVPSGGGFPVRFAAGDTLTFVSLSVPAPLQVRAVVRRDDGTELQVIPSVFGISIDEEVTRQREYTDAADFYDSTPPILVYRVSAQPEYSGSILRMVVGFHEPGRTVKYLRATVVPYNRVGDRVRDSFGTSSARVMATGPFEAAVDPEHFTWENLWFDVGSLSCVVITRLEIEYMDGRTVIYARDLPQVFDEFRNECSVSAQEVNRTL